MGLYVKDIPDLSQVGTPQLVFNSGHSAVGNRTPLPRFSPSHHGHRREGMSMSHHDHAAPGRLAWNAARKVGRKRALKPRKVWFIRFHLGREGRLRNRALFDLATDSKLRGWDLVTIRIGDLVASPED